MELQYTLSAVNSEGKIITKNNIKQNDVKSYLCDLEIYLLNQRGYNINFFPQIFVNGIKIASDLGVRAIPHSPEKVHVSESLRTFFKKIKKIQQHYILLTINNDDDFKFEDNNQLISLIEKEKRMFLENTGITPVT